MKVTVQQIGKALVLPIPSTFPVTAGQHFTVAQTKAGTITFSPMHTNPFETASPTLDLHQHDVMADAPLLDSEWD